MAIDFISYKFYYHSLSLDINNSKRFSYLTGALFSFVLNKTITFRSSKKNIQEPILFILLYALSFILNSFTHSFSHKHFSGNIPFYSATVVSVLINYLGQKLIVFRKS